MQTRHFPSTAIMHGKYLSTIMMLQFILADASRQSSSASRLIDLSIYLCMSADSPAANGWSSWATATTWHTAIMQGYVKYIPAHCVDVTNMSSHDNVFPMWIRYLTHNLAPYLNNYTTAADDFACFAVFVNLTQSSPFTKLLVVINLTIHTYSGPTNCQNTFSLTLVKRIRVNAWNMKSCLSESVTTCSICQHIHTNVF